MSDTELAAGKTTGDGYIFMPNYSSQKLTDVAYILNSDANVNDARGSSYEKVDNALTTPFRPYFKPTSTNGARKQSRAIIFADEQTNMKVHDADTPSGNSFDLNIYAKHKKIVVESNLKDIATLRIMNAEGISISSFTIKPGETVETRVNNSGVYIVQSSNGNNIKKIAVR